MDINWLIDSPAHALPVGDGTHVAVSVDGRRSWSYDELRVERNRYVHALLEQDVKPGDRVGILMLNSLEYFALYFAITRIGAVAVRLNFRLSALELQYAVTDSGCSVVCLHHSRAQQVAPIRQQTAVRLWIAFPDEPPPSGGAAQTSLEELSAWTEPATILTAGNPEAPEIPRPTGADLLTLMYTSGTTGRPKGAMWTHENGVWVAMTQALKWSLTHETVSLTMGPLYHAGAFEILLIPALLVHGTAVTMSSGGMSAARVVDVASRASVSDTLLYPFMLYEMLADPDLDSAIVPNLRRIVTGGDPIMPAAVTALAERLPDVELIQAYGLTEGGPVTTALDYADRHKHPDSVGRPLPLTEVKVVCDDRGNPAESDEPGEVWVRSPVTAVGYWNQPHATARTFIDGWCRTGDLGRVTPDGYLVLTGRAKDMIRSGGENIYPAEIEAVITAHPAVSDAAVVGVPHPTYVEVGCAVLTRAGGADLDVDEVDAFCRRRLASYKCPKHYVVVDDLPRSGSGKVLKTVLRETYRSLGETAELTLASVGDRGGSPMGAAGTGGAAPPVDSTSGLGPVRSITMSADADEAEGHYRRFTESMAAVPNLRLQTMRAYAEGLQALAREPESVTYAEVNAGGVRGLLCTPQSAALGSVVLYAHGGGFVSGSAESHRKLAGHLAKAIGVAALVLDYRLAPEHPFPAQIDDALAAYQWLLKQGWGSGGVIIAGDSAGGNLAIGTTLKLRDLGVTLPGGLIAFSPWVDMQNLGMTLKSNAATDAMVTLDICRTNARLFLGPEGSPTDPLANPLLADLRGLPPMYLTAGGHEVLQDNAERLAIRARQAGVEIELEIAPRQQHVYTFLTGRADAANQTIARVGAWARRQLGLDALPAVGAQS